MAIGSPIMTSWSIVNGVQIFVAVVKPQYK